MVVGDPDSYVKVTYVYGRHTEIDQDLWKYGVEVWCNKQGRYTTIVADLSSLQGQQYEMSLCHLGIMGTQYERKSTIDA